MEFSRICWFCGRTSLIAWKGWLYELQMGGSNTCDRRLRRFWLCHCGESQTGRKAFASIDPGTAIYGMRTAITSDTFAGVVPSDGKRSQWYFEERLFESRPGVGLAGITGCLQLYVRGSEADTGPSGEPEEIASAVGAYAGPL